VFVRSVRRGLIRGVRGIGGCILRWKRRVAVDDEKVRLVLGCGREGFWVLGGDYLVWELITRSPRINNRIAGAGKSTATSFPGRQGWTTTLQVSPRHTTIGLSFYTGRFATI
jgi:hypothetical protein